MFHFGNGAGRSGITAGHDRFKLGTVDWHSSHGGTLVSQRIHRYAPLEKVDEMDKKIETWYISLFRGSDLVEASDRVC